jgi:hypothetical protein
LLVHPARHCLLLLTMFQFCCNKLTVLCHLRTELPTHRNKREIR